MKDATEYSVTISKMSLPSGNIHWIPKSSFKVSELKMVTQDHSSLVTTSPSSSSTSHRGLSGGGMTGDTTPTSELEQRRVFYHVDITGKRKRDHRGKMYPPYGINVRPGQRGPGPVDAVRKIIHRMLQEKSMSGGSTSRSVGGSLATDVIPSSVRTAVARAVRQNFMCDCHGQHCVTGGRCASRSEEKGDEYLEEYYADTASSFAQSVTVCIQEDGKDKVRHYTGCYRRLSNPNKHCIRRGIRKETVANYVETFDPRKMAQH